MEQATPQSAPYATRQSISVLTRHQWTPSKAWWMTSTPSYRLHVCIKIQHTYKCVCIYTYTHTHTHTFTSILQLTTTDSEWFIPLRSPDEHYTSGIKPDELWEPHFRKQCRQQPCFYLSPTYSTNTSHYLHNTTCEDHVVATPVLFTSRLSHACYMPSYDTLLDFITLIIFCIDYKL